MAQSPISEFKKSLSGMPGRQLGGGAGGPPPDLVK